MDRAHAPTITMTALVPDADKWSNGIMDSPHAATITVMLLLALVLDAAKWSNR